MRSYFSLDEYHLSTIDLDNASFSILKPILEFIVKCPNSVYVAYRDSCRLDGYHIKIYCNKKCLYCRDKWDDPHRFLWDLIHESRKEEHKKNVLWKHKTRSKAGKKICFEAGEWIIVKEVGD